MSTTDQLERITTHLNTLLEWAGQKGDAAVGLIEREAPLVAHEIVAWYFASSAVWVAVLSPIALFLLIYGIRLFRHATKLGEDKDPKAEDIGVFSLLILALSALLLIPIFINTSCMVKASVAPRLVVIEQVTKLITPNK